jgi:hypothetical protein
MKVTALEAKPLLIDALKANLVPFLRSSPGLGKSSLIQQIAEDHNLQLIDIRLSQMEPTDLLGLPFREGDQAKYIPFNLFPLANHPLPTNQKGWLILLDEFSSASLAVQAAAYRLILDHQVGDYPLHPKARLICAGNLLSDKAIVTRLSTALQSRLCTLELIPCLKSWITWADLNNIDHRIKSFLNFKPEGLHRFNPNFEEESFPTPRTWEFLNRLLNLWSTVTYEKLPLIAGVIGESMAREFYSFTQIYNQLPTLESIQANPTDVPIPNEPSIHFALSGMIAEHLSPTNVVPLMQFLERLGIDFQVITLRSAIAKTPALREAAPIRTWIRTNARERLQ